MNRDALRVTGGKGLLNAYAYISITDYLREIP